MTASPAVPAARPQATVGRALRSEWIKFAGLRSSWWLLGTAVVAPLLMTLVWSASQGSTANADAALAAATPSSFATMVILVLIGTVVATAEHENHAIMQTFTVVPRRTPVVLAKFALVLGIAAIIALLTTFGTFLLADAITGVGGGAWTGDAVRVLLDIALFETCAALIAVSAGLIVRSTIGSVGVVFGFFYIVPTILSLIPIGAVNLFGKTIPGAGSTPLYSLTPEAGQLDPAVVVVSMLLWTAAWMVAAVIVVRRRNV